VKKSDKQPVPDSIYFCLYMDKDKLVGAVNTQHRLNNKLLLNGGHIGDGVRPSEQEKGIALQ
jgi:predicted acetyltransferase